MLDLLIINPRIIWFSSKSLIANGPLTLASYLDSKGFKVKVIDDNSMYRKWTTEEFAEACEDAKNIGISVSTLNARNAYLLAGELRKRFPGKPIIGGGLHSYDSYGEMEAHFDIVFKGEAERSVRFFLNLNTESAGKHYSGFNKPVESYPIDNLDDLPSMNFNLVNMSDYIHAPSDHHAVTNHLVFQRGCPYFCTFCKSGQLSGKVRTNTAEYMIRELTNRHNLYGMMHFFILDSNFTIDRNRLHKFCELMIESGLNKKIQLIIQTSVCIALADDELKLLKDAGVTMVGIGVERFDEHSRKLIRKTGTGHDAAILIKRLHWHGIKVMANLLINFPFETTATLQSEARLLDKILPYCSVLYINYLLPIPGTSIHSNLPEDRKKWYLEKSTVEYQSKYYDISHLIEGPLALQLNLFNLPETVIIAMRSFKNHYQLMGFLRLSKSRLFKIVILLDQLLGRISYYLPVWLEQILFAIPKYVRLKGYKLMFEKIM